MKKMNVMATAIAIALCATVTGCANKSEKNKEPEGTKMGNVYVVQKDNAVSHIIMADGYEDQTDFISITDHKDFLVGIDGDKTAHLLDLNGSNFAVCDSFKVKDVYPVKAGEKTSKYIELTLNNGNHAARGYAKPHASLTNLTGVKEEIYPLSNGWIIYKMKGLYSFAKADAENGVMDPVFKEIAVVSVKDKIYFLVKSSDYTGYIDIEGNGVKSLAPAAYKAAKNSGTKLWSEGVVSGIEKDKL